MPTINIEGIGRVTPSDDFFQMGPAEQSKEVDAFVKQYQARQEAQQAPPPNTLSDANAVSGPSPDELKYRSGILPVGKTQSGDIVPAVPGILEGPRKAVMDLLEGKRTADQITGKEIFELGGLLAPGASQNAPIATATKNLAAKVSAQKEVGRALERDNLTPTDVQTAAATGPRPEQATLADVGGTNVQGLSERVAQTPGGARADAESFLTERQRGQLTRVTGDLKDLSGTDSSAVQSIKDTIAKRSTDAAPAYNAAYGAGDRVIINDELRRLSAVPEVQTAMRGAISGWQRDQIASGYGAMKPGINVAETKTIDGVETGAFPTVEVGGGKVPVTPNLQFWDYTKGNLDSMIEAAIKPDGTLTRQGRALTIIKNKMLAALDQEVPEYAAARSTWGGPSSYLSAIQEGKGFRSISAEEVSAKINSLSEADKEAYRIGALSSLFTKMGNKTGKLADITVELRSPEMRGKISALMPNAQAAAKWDRILNFETNSSGLVGRSLAGSPTARRVLESADAGSMAGDLVTDAFMGAPVMSLFKKIVVGGAKSVRNKMMSAKDEEVANLLYDPQALGGLGQPVNKFSGQSVTPLNGLLGSFGK